MQTAPVSVTSAAPAPPDRREATPRIKISRRGVSIDHPDQDTGERLMAAALGVADRDAMYGILRQLVKASVIGRKPDAANLALMISMVESIKPRDNIEAMLVAQMVAVHVAAMRSAHQLGCIEDLDRLEGATRALTRLARTFPAQVEALNRHRNASEPAITVQNLSVQDGGKAIVGNVTQHASLTFSDARPAQECGDRAHGPLCANAAGA
jgi:hypothetical protein